MFNSFCNDFFKRSFSCHLLSFFSSCWDIECTFEQSTINGIKSATWRFLFKIREPPIKTTLKKSATKWRFFYAVKKATIVSLFLLVRFFYWVFAFFTGAFFSLNGGRYITHNELEMHTTRTRIQMCVTKTHCVLREGITKKTEGCMQ